jgi:MoxR-like ATPase
MKSTQMMKSLSTLISIQQPSFVWGGVGIGKSEMIHSVGESLGYQMRDVRVALLDPVDLRGVPSVEDGVTKWNPPIFLPTEDEPKTLLFLDELPHGSPSVQNALFQLVKDRKLGEYRLPDSTVIVLGRIV